MSAPSTETLVPVAVLTASLMGSLHCVSMCGGLVTAAARTRFELARYHLGRLVGYGSLGAGAGLLGKHILLLASHGWIAWVSTSLVAAALILLGIRVWARKPLHLFFVPASWTQRLLGWSSQRPFAFGAATAFLPCGWLHTFVLSAITAQSPLRGALLLSAFWAGTLPALVSAPLLIREFARPLARWAPRATAILLIMAGFGSLALKSRVLLASTHSDQTEQPHCH